MNNQYFQAFDDNRDLRVNIQELKSKIDPCLFYEREGLNLQCRKKSAWLAAGLCPFHDDQKAGSFYIHIESGAFKCFSCGSKGGDVIAFKQKKNHLNFYHAIQQLHHEWGQK